MKILFINLPYYGHVLPTIGLVRELIRQGCSVTYLLPFDWQETVSESGAAFHGYENSKRLSEQMKNAYAAAENIVKEFDFIMYEQFFFLGKHLAEKYQKPVIRIFTAPATNDKLMKEFISAKGPLSVFRHKWIAKAFTKDIAKNISLKTDNWLDEIVCNPPELNFVYTLREYQPYEEEFSEENYKFLGPSVYERKSAAFDFVKRENRVVYISLGTVIKGKTAFFQTCIEAFQDENIDVIISAGQKSNLKKMKNIPSNIHIYSSVPQIEVLKTADAFVTHGGMNSISEALVYGVPMLVIPFVSDQPTNAKYIEKLGVGKTSAYSEINRDTLKNTVFSIMADQNIKNNLTQLQKSIEKSSGNRGGAEMAIRYFKEKDYEIHQKSGRYEND